MRALLISGLAAVCVSSPVLAGPNWLTTLALHAVETDFGPCSIPDPCMPGPPTVDVTPGTMQVVYLFVRNYDNVAALQTAFDFGDWTFLFGLWDCQAQQVCGVPPTPEGGPTHGTVATAFDCISGGLTAIVGRLAAVAGSGCVTQVESSFPFGTHVVSCTDDYDPVPEPHRGSVCGGPGGRDACEPQWPVVECVTWGAIKAAGSAARCCRISDPGR